MRFINLEQGTKEWLAWRKKGLGASDAPIITGLSKYKTPYRLWQELLGLVEPEQAGFIAEVGHKFEPRARAQFSLETDLEVEPACAEHDDFPFLRASFDGLNEDARVFVEIKLVGRQKLDWIKDNKKPLPEHADQVFQQFLVSKYERGYYCAYTVDANYTDMTDCFITRCQPDHIYMGKLFQRLQHFWDLVETQTPPDLDPRDEYAFTDPKSNELANEYLRLKSEITEREQRLEHVENLLKGLASQHARVRIGDLVVQNCLQKGTIDYKRIPELKNIDLEKYRGNPISFQRIDVKG